MSERFEHVEPPDEHDDVELNVLLLSHDDRLRESRSGRASAASWTMPCFGHTAWVVWARGNDCAGQSESARSSAR